VCHDVDLAARLQRSVERLLDRLMDASRQIQDSRQLETDLQQSVEQATRNVDELTARCDDLEQQLRQETQTREFLSVEFYKADGMIFHYNLTTNVTAYNGSSTLASKQSSYSVVKQEDVTVFLNTTRRICARTMDVTEPANIRIRMWISYPKSVGFGCGCGCGFVARSKLPAIMVTVIQLSYLKLSSCN